MYAFVVLYNFNLSEKRGEVNSVDSEDGEARERG